MTALNWMFQDFAGCNAHDYVSIDVDFQYGFHGNGKFDRDIYVYVGHIDNGIAQTAHMDIFNLFFRFCR